MPERESKVNLVYEVDKQGLSAVERSTKKVKSVFDKLKNSVSSSTKRTRNEFAELKDDLRDVRKEAEAVGDEFGAIGDKAKRAGDVEFGSGESGNIGGRFGQARGALGQLGIGGGVEKGLGIGQSVFELGQALPELKEGFGGLASSMGISTMQLGAMGVALAGATVAMVLLSKESTKIKENVASNVAGIEQANALLAQENKEAVNARIQEIDTIRIGTKATLDYANAERERYEASELLPGLLGDLQVAGNRIFNTGTKNLNTLVQLQDETTRLTGDMTELDAEYDRLTEGVEDLTASTSEAGKAVVTAASAESERIRFIQKAGEMGVEASQARLTAIEQEREVILAELQALQTSGDTSEEVTARIKALESSMSSLDTETGILTNSLRSGAAAANDASKEFSKVQQDTVRTQQQTVDKIGAANQKYSDALSSIARSSSQSIANIKRGTVEGFKKLSEDFKQGNLDAMKDAQNELSDLRQDAYRDEQQDFRENQRTFRDLRRDSIRDEKDAIRSRDVLALSDIRERTKEEVDDARTRIKDEKTERDIAFKNELKDYTVNQGRIRQERLRDFKRQQADLRKSESKSLADARRAKSRQLADAARARDAEIRMAKEAYAAQLKILEEFFKRSTQLARGATSSVGGSSSGGSTAPSPGGTASLADLLESIGV